MGETASVRLNKYMASCGLGSRRECDAIIASGDVLVNGKPAEVGQRVDPENVIVTYKGEPLEAVRSKEYYLYHKPRGVIVSVRDPHNPFTIYDDLREKGFDATHLKYVGRLDKESEGVLILTNDGDLCHAITHPRFHIKKTYEVSVEKKLKDEWIEQMVEEGVESEGQILHAGSVYYRGLIEGLHCYKVELYEGKNRQIRRLFGAFGHTVVRLIRTQFANIKLDDVAYGQWVELQGRQIEGLLSKGHTVKHKKKKGNNYSQKRK